MKGRGLAIVNLLVSVLALGTSLAAIALIVLTHRASDDNSEGPTGEETTTIEPAEPVDPDAPRGSLPTAAGQVGIADVTAGSLPSVVNISTTRVTQGRAPTGTFFDILRPFLGGGGPRESQSLGSGVIVDDNGIILTNHHVVADATEIRVTFFDGREYSARSVGSDSQSDVAVVRIDIPHGETLEIDALAYGDSTELRQGDTVIAIGNPFGVGQTVTMGIVSATGRAAMGITDYEDFIQTDAAINPGNSGGALINLRGELVGINTAILSRTGGNQGIGFAIPSNMARPIAEALLRDGHVTRGWLGISLQDLNPQLARSMGIQGRQGAVVTHIEPTGPAAGVDLERRDVIIALDNETIRSSRQFRNLIATRGAGTAIRLTRLRAGVAGEVRVTLATRPEGSAGPLPPPPQGH